VRFSLPKPCVDMSGEAVLRTLQLIVALRRRSCWWSCAWASAPGYPRVALAAPENGGELGPEQERFQHQNLHPDVLRPPLSDTHNDQDRERPVQVGEFSLKSLQRPHF
jgi:hypothetical protein